MINKLIIAIILLNICSIGDAQNARKKTITRVFWQDRESNKLSYADLSTTDRWHIKRGWVNGFPKATSGHELGPMLQLGKVVAVALRDGDESKLVRIDSGVVEEPHGNHFHWKYTGQPTANLIVPLESKVDQALVHGQNFFFSMNGGGFVRLNPSTLPQNTPASLFKGGGSSMSLAVSDSLAYATDSSAGKSRVDVVNLYGNSSSGNFETSTTGVTSSIIAGGKWFASGEDGLSWSNLGASQNVRLIPSSQNLGKNVSELTVEQSWVLFSTLQAGKNSLCLVNSQSPSPNVFQLAISSEAGLRLSAPKTKLSMGKRYAFMFLEKIDPAATATEKLVVVDLDPNRDGNYQDAKIAKTMNVGSSKVSENTGHHGICFDAYGRFAIFSDPGDGMLSIMTLNDFQLRAKFRVKGAPDRIVAVGSPEHFH